MSIEPKIISLFEGIEDPALQQAIGQLPVRKFPKAMVIFQQRERSDEVYAILSGSVEIVRQEGDGELQRLAVLQPGQIFGEFSYLTGAPRTTAAAALEEVAVLELTARWLADAEKRNPAIRDRLTQLYRSRVLTNVLHGTQLFATLQPQEIEQIATKLLFRELKDGEEILREGSTDLDLIVIKRGRIAVTKKKGTDILRLGELTTGDILGEMAIVTGQPRSASARAVEPTEVMVLPGADFRDLLQSFPRLLRVIEDLVRSRAEQTRQAVEAVVQEIVGDAWTDVDDAAGIQVQSLKLAATFAADGAGADAQLLTVSRHHWTLERAESAPPLVKGSEVQLAITTHRVKELAPLLSQGPIGGTISSVEDRKFTVTLAGAGESQARIANIVTALARARVRLFVYPEYDVEKLAVIARFRTKSGIDEQIPVFTLSQTSGRVGAGGEWKPGELLSITLRQDGKDLLTTKAVCLVIEAGRREIQFEYETGDERAALERTIRELSRQTGYGRLAAPSAAAKPAFKPDRDAPILTKHFRTSSEFLKTYVGSMEAGLIRVESKDKLPRGTYVRIHVAIASEKGLRRLSFTGYVRQWENGVNEIELDDTAGPIREKIEQLCKRLVDEQAEASWKTRKQQLTESGIAISEVSALQKWARLAAAVLVLGGLLWWGMSGKREEPLSSQPKTDRAEGPKDVVLTLAGTNGPVTLRSSEIRSIKIVPGQDSVSIQASGKTFDVPAAETAKLTPFQQKQLQRYRAFERKSNP
ncbi:MAG TPA: cyclic nucleotide-binding domain-containing protein [Bdellovibrionota bacterium]|nr:cyclic nucleotide-binding domain-containing protein [Bdellovibrionota bacterium]